MQQPSLEEIYNTYYKKIYSFVNIKIVHKKALQELRDALQSA